MTMPYVDVAEVTFGDAGVSALLMRADLCATIVRDDDVGGGAVEKEKQISD